MEKEKKGDYFETITFEQLIDHLTDGRGEELKKEYRKLEKQQ